MEVSGRLTGVDDVEDGNVGTVIFTGADDGVVTKEVEGVVVVGFGFDRAVVFGEDHAEVFVTVDDHGVFFVSGLENRAELTNGLHWEYFIKMAASTT